MNVSDQIAKMVNDLANYTGTTILPDTLKGDQSALNVLECVIAEAIDIIADVPDCDSCDRIDLDNPPEPSWMP